MFFTLEPTKSAQNKYNKKTQKAYDWLRTIPWELFGIVKNDGIDQQEIINLQNAIGVLADGLVGLGTLKALQKVLKVRFQLLWNPISGEISEVSSSSLESNHILWKGLEVPLPQVESCTIYTYRDPQGLNLHEVGSFNKRSRTINSAIVHWGGLNPQHLARVFSNRKASSHFAVGRSEDSGEVGIYQYLDVAHIAWHAVGANTNSIGIDICQQPEVKHLGYYANRQYDVQTIDNPAAPHYGPPKVISLDSQIKTATVELLRGLEVAFSIPKCIPPTSQHQIDKDLLAQGGIFSHFHVDFKNQRKWDVAPWWDSIREEFESKALRT